mmetsp:Transcript_31663/g.98557  ORF Transcript_31663/g.98557 Transcript_31663/m.98557 type:complete len:280 (+) Transcript_31663:387-1226(+)
MRHRRQQHAVIRDRQRRGDRRAGPLPHHCALEALVRPSPAFSVLHTRRAPNSAADSREASLGGRVRGHRPRPLPLPDGPRRARLCSAAVSMDRGAGGRAQRGGAPDDPREGARGRLARALRSARRRHRPGLPAHAGDPRLGIGGVLGEVQARRARRERGEGARGRPRRHPGGPRVRPCGRLRLGRGSGAPRQGAGALGPERRAVAASPGHIHPPRGRLLRPLLRVHGQHLRRHHRADPKGGAAVGVGQQGADVGRGPVGAVAAASQVRANEEQMRGPRG